MLLKCAFIIALIGVCYSAECSAAEVASLPCAASDNVEADCKKQDSCIWCPRDDMNVPICTISKSGKCECKRSSVSTSTGGNCVDKAGPTCTVTTAASNDTEVGAICNTASVVSFTAGKCPSVDFSSSARLTVALASLVALTTFLFLL